MKKEEDRRSLRVSVGFSGVHMVRDEVVWMQELGTESGCSMGGAVASYTSHHLMLPRICTSRMLESGA